MSRLATLFEALRAKNEKAAGLFVTNGFPDPAGTLPILHAIDAGGADFIELGMPFSDPLAEGLPIQRSSERALKHGIVMQDAFEVVRAFREKSETPVLLMGYINPLLRYGLSNFCTDARSSGVDGLILPDVPPEESGPIQAAADAAGLDMVYLIAPNTPDARIQSTDERATGFVYGVSITGLTGSAIKGQDGVSAYLMRARQLVKQNPLLVGFGIKNHADAVRLSEHTDGFIVGSALIQEIERLWDETNLPLAERLEVLQHFVSALKHGDPTPA